MRATEKKNDDGLTFGDWMSEADARVQERAGVSVHDLADGPSWDSWNDGVQPAEYADELLAEEGFDPDA